MRRALSICALVLCFAPPAAHAQSGGAAAPGESGGTEYGAPIAPVQKKPRKKAPPVPPVATEFTVSPGTLVPEAALTFGWRVDGGKGKVRIRIDLVKSGSRIVAKRLTYGWKTTGKHYDRSWTPAGQLAPGSYVARIHAVDSAGRALLRSATASGKSRLQIIVPPVSVVDGVFPVQGAWTWGSDGGGFGADRGDHSHQGQDISAAEGTPLVSPVAGSVFFRDFQKGGAGYYMVIRGEDGRDYVFMHLLEGSPLLEKGDVVAKGQQFAQVGNSGRSSGPHLHFEIWPDGWYSSKESKPIDPRPEMEAWASSPAAG
jgi:murein DD-endopeptidase MepM/ murein hydrolase activator NlpD